MFKTLLSIKTESAHYEIANKYENMQSNTTIPSHRTGANTGSNRCRFLCLFLCLRFIWLLYKFGSSISQCY